MVSRRSPARSSWRTSGRSVACTQRIARSVPAAPASTSGAARRKVGSSSASRSVTPGVTSTTTPSLRAHGVTKCPAAAPDADDPTPAAVSYDEQDEPHDHLSSHECEIVHWVDGSPLTGSPTGWADVTNPATGRVTGRVALASEADAAHVIAAASRAARGWGTTSLARRTQVMFAFRELLNARKDELAAIITAEHGKVHSDAMGEIARGLEVVEFACGISHLLKGGHSEEASTGVDVHSKRVPLGVVGIISPFNFPAMVPMWFFPIAIAAGNAVVLKPSEKDPSAAHLDRRAVAGGRAPRRRLQRPARRQDRRRRAAHQPRRAGDQLRRLDPDRGVRLRDREPARQARPGPRRRQEPHGRAARRRPRPRRGLGGQRRLRQRGRALHGDQRARRGRPDRRRARRPDRRPHPHPADRRRRPRGHGRRRDRQGGRHGSARHEGPPRPGELVHRLRRGRRREGRRRRPRRRSARGGRGGLLARPDALRRRHPRHGRLPRGDLRPGAVGGPRRSRTRRRSRWSTPTSTATAPRSSPTTAARPAASRPTSRSG